MKCSFSLSSSIDASDALSQFLSSRQLSQLSRFIALPIASYSNECLCYLYFTVLIELWNNLKSARKRSARGMSWI